jgi:hypothetical protein
MYLKAALLHLLRVHNGRLHLAAHKVPLKKLQAVHHHRQMLRSYPCHLDHLQ